MKQSQPAHRHHHPVLVAGLNDGVVALTAAGLKHVAHARLRGAVDRVAEREERIALEADAVELRDPLAAFLGRERLRGRRERLLRDLLLERRRVLQKVLVDGVVLLGA